MFLYIYWLLYIETFKAEYKVNSKNFYTPKVNMVMLYFHLRFSSSYYFILWDECQCYLLAFSYSLQFTTVLLLYCCIVLWVGSINKQTNYQPAVMTKSPMGWLRRHKLRLLTYLFHRFYWANRSEFLKIDSMYATILCSFHCRWFLFSIRKYSKF